MSGSLIEGNNFSNNLNGTNGSDTILGYGGNDTLNGNGGNDFLYGGTGNDSISGGSGNDYADGEAGNDNISGGTGNDTLYGGDGNDSLVGDNGNDNISGGTGNDTLSGGNDNDTLDGGTGNDSLSGGNDNDILYGNDGNDTLSGGNAADTLIGGAGADSIVGDGGGGFGTDGNDVIYGAGTYDTLTGTITNTGDGGVRDTLIGGGGNDTIYADWNDLVQGGSGTDTAVLPTSGNWTDTGNNTVIGGTSYDVWSDGNGHFIYLNSIENVTTVGGAPCYLEGTRVMTARGEVAVEDLEIGDLIVTAHGRGPVLQPVVWIGKRRVNLARHPKREAVEPILIRAGALGEGVPFRDLRVSPEHAMFVDGRLVPARLLVNGTSIVREPWWPVVTWYHVELPEHGLLMAEGAPAESYFDAGNRHMFGEGALAALFPDFAAGRDERRYEEAACFPLLREEGPELAAIRARLDERAAAVFGTAPATSATDEPGWAIRMPVGARRRSAG